MISIENSGGRITDTIDSQREKKVRFLDGAELQSALDDIIADSLEICIASAFLNFAGVAMLEKYLKKHKQVQSIRILLDENFHSDSDVKKTLLSKLSALPNTQVRLFCDDKKVFHAKMFLLKGKDKIDVIVGSSNLTAGGLFHNVEMNTLFASESEEPQIVKIRAVYDEYWARGITADDFVRKMEGCMNATGFKIGDKVIIGHKIDYGIGTIVDIDGEQVDIYFKEKGLAEIAHVQDIQPALEPFDLAQEQRFDEPTTFDLRTRALFLPIMNRHGILSNSIIEILPHQILAAHKVMSRESKHFLLADEVGLGKTFEAGIIIRELIGRDEAERILLVTPAGLAIQWQEDMAKFDLDFTIYRSGFEEAIKDFWNKVNLVITSIDTIKQEENLKELLGARPWDVVVFDEAHHLTRKDYGQKADKSDRYRAAEQLRDKTKALLFLTATPHQGDRNKFFNLIKLLDEDLFKDENDLWQNRARLDKIMIRQRKIDVTDEEGKPLFVRRMVNALHYNPSAEEKEFFRRLDNYLYQGYGIASQDAGKRYQALGFVMTTFQKIAASSIYAVKLALEERLIRLLFIEITKEKDESSVECLRKEIVSHARYKYDARQGDDQIFREEEARFEKYIREEGIDPHEFLATPDEIDLLKDLLAHVPINEDTKLVKLIENINAIRKSGPVEKVIVFTEYLNTQDYIVRKLKETYGDREVVFIRGGAHDLKISAVHTFKHSAHFLVSTQAGGEGINLQHCHIMVNYDMPWNPMKVEQRIGRIHRYGQKDTAQIYNMFAAGTIEDRIYQKLEDKLYEITQTIGDEDEREAYRENILGIIAEELNFDDLYKEVLRRGQVADEITQEKIDAAVARAKEVYEKLGDFAQDLEKFSLDKYRKAKSSVTLDDVKKFVLDFVRSQNKKVSEEPDGTCEFIAPEIITTYGGHRYTKITFDRDRAIEDGGLEFMAIGHPVTDAILSICSGYQYGGRCVKRQISDAKYKGESGLQCNFTIEYMVPVPDEQKNRILRRDLEIIIFDNERKYREDLREISLIASQKRSSEEDFSFATEAYLKEVKELCKRKLQEIVTQNVIAFQKDFPNTVHKENLENIALFVVK